MREFYQHFKRITLVVCCCIFNLAIFAQSSKIGGSVTDEKNEPLVGATISIKGSNKATLSDANGSFIINAQKGQTLLIRFIGYEAQEFGISDQRNLQIVLKGESKSLNEVVVTALGIRKETKRLGYAIQTVNGDDLLKARDPNPITGLVGKVAGLSVGPSAEILRAPNVTIRGDGVTLYVVDGFPINTDTWNISPDDIQTYTVLKGPAAAALYGNRALNGAILITTKKGEKNKKGLTVDVNSSTVINKGFLAFPRTQNSYGPGENTFYKFVDGKGGAPGGVDGDYDVWGPYFNGQLIPQYNSPVINGVRQATPWLARGKDNLKNFLQTGYQTNNNISLSANGDNYTTRFSVSQAHQQSYIPNNYLDIANFNMYASFNPTSRFKIEGNLDFNRQSTDNFPDVDYGPNSLIYNIAIWTGADWDVNAPDIKAIWQPGKVGVQSQFEEYQRYHNPYFMTQKWTRGHFKNDLYGYISSNYKINDHINATFRSQINTYNLLRTEKLPYSAHPYGREANLGDYREDRRDLFDNNTELLLNYSYTIKKFLNLSGLVGSNIRNLSFNSNWTSTDYLNVPEVYAFSNSKNPIQSSSFNSQMRVFSIYGSLDATLGKYATIAGTLRQDKSSAFQNVTTYSYPSLSVSTVLSDYLKTPSFISFLKVRGSFSDVRADATSPTIGPAPYSSITAFGGSTGASLFNNPIGYGNNYNSPYNGPSYALNTSYSTNKLYNNQSAGFASDFLYQDNIKTSTRINYEEGFDIKFLKNRLGFSGTAFQYIDGPSILRNAISSATGDYFLFLNALKTKKTGYEGSFSGTPIKNAHGINWDVLVNVSTYKTVYKEFPPGQTTYPNSFFQLGDRVDKFYGSAFVRTADGQIINDKAGKPLVNPVPQYLGNFNSDYAWSIFNKIKFRSVSMGFQFDGSVGGVTTDYMHNKTMRGGSNIETAQGLLGDARYKDWQNFGVAGYNGSYIGQGVFITNGTAINYNTATGQILNEKDLQYAPNIKTVFVQDYASKFYNVQEANLMSKTFSKLREITITYELPQKLLNKTFISKAAISVIGRNLLYFYKDKKFKDVDLDQYNYATGTTQLQSPTVRSFGFNLNLTF